MIISHHHKFLFVAIPKTGTHAIREVLRPNLHQYDWEQCQLLVKKEFPIKALAQFKTGHLTCEQVINFFPEGTWKQYFKFCIVRNPYLRFLSFCNFYFPEQMKQKPQQTMLQALENPGSLGHHQFFLRPQYQYIYNDNLDLQIDFIGKLENIELDFKQISQQINLPHLKLQKVNSSEQIVKNLNTKIANLVYKTYELDFNLFQYSDSLDDIF